MQKINGGTCGDMEFVATYLGTSVRVYARSEFAAQQRALKFFRVPENKSHHLTIAKRELR